MSCKAVASPDGPFPGLPLADEHWRVDTRDSEQLLTLAQNKKINGVVTSGTDVAVPSIGLLVETLGLAGCGHESARLCSNKLLMKER